ncbi:DUF6364 family protein [Neolewinella antarctica]|uniref:Uncharacterized protein n=1 Tax=Neolewinella antarctica TaxID=442734 RepID=A0ABX0XHH4_9BACT|nr:DUF6364 family protein [Neolewinella antarctica]NJC28202.1 hypothetical protein [Neolewinella antarctica]
MELVKTDKKLTLSLKSSVIDKAKVYAKGRNTSLSRLFENYLEAVFAQEEKTEAEANFSPTVKRLLGIIDLPDDYDHKVDYGNHLIEKYK